MLLLSACQPAAEAPAEPVKISESDAEIIANRNEVEFTSMNAARIKAAYAADVVAFDPGVPGLMMDRDTFDKAQDEFAAQKLDTFQRKDRKIQILDADTFIVSGTAELASTIVPGNAATFRYTDVYEKQADDKWKIVNEHISLTK
jgi:ketosteroid isomerase-like protein